EYGLGLPYIPVLVLNRVDGFNECPRETIVTATMRFGLFRRRFWYIENFGFSRCKGIYRDGFAVVRNLSQGSVDTASAFALLLRTRNHVEGGEFGASASQTGGHIET